MLKIMGMVVNLISEAGLADLVQTTKLVEVHGIPVRHYQPMEDHGQSALAETLYLAGSAQHKGAFGNEDVLTVM